MPNISIYLNNETLEVVRAKSKVEKLPISHFELYHEKGVRIINLKNKA